MSFRFESTDNLNEFDSNMMKAHEYLHKRDKLTVLGPAPIMIARPFGAILSVLFEFIKNDNMS